MRRAARNEERRAREGRACDPRLGRTAGHPARQQEHADARQRDVDEIDDVERSHDAEPGLERKRKEVREDRVVVKREAHRAIQGKDAHRRERPSVEIDKLVAEDPDVPDVDPGVATWCARQVSGEIKRQRPGLEQRDADERQARDHDAASRGARDPGGRQLIQRFHSCTPLAAAQATSAAMASRATWRVRHAHAAPSPARTTAAG